MVPLIKKIKEVGQGSGKIVTVTTAVAATTAIIQLFGFKLNLLCIAALKNVFPQVF